jgi:hypothetical protein
VKRGIDENPVESLKIGLGRKANGLGILKHDENRSGLAPGDLLKNRDRRYFPKLISLLFILFAAYNELKIEKPAELSRHENQVTARKLMGLDHYQGLAYAPGLSVSDSSQVKLLITNNSFCIVQRATEQSKTGFFRDYGVAEAPPGFQAGWSYCVYFFSLFLFILFSHLGFPCKFLYS